MPLVCDVRDFWILALSAGHSSLISPIHNISCWDAAVAFVCSYTKCPKKQETHNPAGSSITEDWWSLSVRVKSV